MAEVAPAPVPAKAPKKKAASRPKKAGPSIGELIVKAVSVSNERNGMSLGALKRALAAGGYGVKLAVNNLVKKGTHVHIKGTGASGSFKLNKKQTEAKKTAKKTVAKKPAAAKKPKKVAAKKPPAAAKKVTRKAKKPATPKKAAKSPKKAKAVKPKANKASPKKK